MKIWVGRDRSRVEEGEVDALHAEIAALRERVETLEQIVTDEKYTLEREIESLG